MKDEIIESNIEELKFIRDGGNRTVITFRTEEEKKEILIRYLIEKECHNNE